jgi:hypothetical protein
MSNIRTLRDRPTKHLSGTYTENRVRKLNGDACGCNESAARHLCMLEVSLDRLNKTMELL